MDIEVYKIIGAIQKKNGKFTYLNFTEKLYPFAGKGKFVNISLGASINTIYPFNTVTAVCSFKLESS